jgi:hypothetical protein
MLKNYYTTEEEVFLLSLYKKYSEKLQRHFLAGERVRLGSRSVAYLCRVYKCSSKRIYAGLAELAEICEGGETIDYGRQRRAGGGAKKKK